MLNKLKIRPVVGVSDFFCLVSEEVIVFLSKEEEQNLSEKPVRALLTTEMEMPTVALNHLT